ncbi:hypothetical protein IEE94_13630 [Yimella sp. cx-573]|nr:hypothetical protein [Yimella sp. cx-573]
MTGLALGDSCDFLYDEPITPGVATALAVYQLHSLIRSWRGPQDRNLSKLLSATGHDLLAWSVGHESGELVAEMPDHEWPWLLRLKPFQEQHGNPTGTVTAVKDGLKPKGGTSRGVHGIVRVAPCSLLGITRQRTVGRTRYDRHGASRSFAHTRPVDRLGTPPVTRKAVRPLFAGAVEPSYEPDLKLAGLIAMAPPSQLADAVNFSAGAPMKVTAFVAPLVVAAARLDGTPLSQVVSPAGQAKLSDIDNTCVGELVGTDSVGGVVSDKFLVRGPALDKTMQTIRRNDASAVTSRVPTLILQGGKDELVRPDFTDQLDRQLRGRSFKVSYVRKDGVNHVDLLKVAWPDAEKFLCTSR